MKLFPLIADNWKMDGGVAFGVVPRTIWSRFHEPDELNLIDITTRCLLIIHNEKKILIDAGLGDKRNEKYYAVRYREPGINILNSLEQQGFSADDITDVLFTHLHDDHVGAATLYNESGIPECVFKNAQYWVSQTHWDWAMNPNKREGAAFFKDNLLPLRESGRLHLVEEGTQPFENITLKIYNGHTHGQIIPHIHTANQTVVYMGDFIPTQTNIPIPFVPSVDIEPLVSLKEKEEFLNEAVDKKYILFFEHDAANECCSVKQSEKGVVADRSFKLQDIQL
ncbi:MAG: MBL fold metallo-hydrolase [Bacteroidales bacterium]|nr:MBL fold metallo-hydrolase [Bacteroidales bacterium]